LVFYRVADDHGGIGDTVNPVDGLAQSGLCVAASRAGRGGLSCMADSLPRALAGVKTPRRPEAAIVAHSTA